jgi:hypothetical protein
MALSSLQKAYLTLRYKQYKPKAATELRPGQFEALERLGSSENLWDEIDGFLAAKVAADPTIKKMPWQKK